MFGYKEHPVVASRFLWIKFTHCETQCTVSLLKAFAKLQKKKAGNVFFSVEDRLRNFFLKKEQYSN